MTSTITDPASQVFRAFTRPRRRPASQDDLQALSGATRHTVDYRGVALAAWSWGDGAPVLLLHGWEGRGSRMAAFAPALAQAGFRAIALDAPAHGDSQGEITDVVDYGKAVAATVDQFGPVTAVIAHSVGSPAAQYAFAHGVRASASIHISGPVSLMRVLRRAGAMAGLDGAGMAHLEALFVAHLGAPLEVMELDALRAGMIHPALILHDPDDLEMPVDESRALARAWPGSALSLAPGLGHHRIVRSPSVIKLAVDFITKTAAERSQ
ncbi:MAG: alpha/beta fold hydrolase [Alphaproteobacteria bacterium]